MALLEKEEKENALIEYNVLREEIWERDNKTWIVSAILIFGSLLAAFAPEVGGFPTAIVSIILIVAAAILQYSSSRASAVDSVRLEELAMRLNLTEPTRTYETQMTGRWWVVVSRNVAYVLFAILISIYLYFIFTNILVLVVALVIGLLLVMARGERGGKRYAPTPGYR